MGNPIFDKLMPAPKEGGFRLEDYYIWCGSTILGEDGRYHMFASRWRKELGFGAQWLFNCEVVRASSKTPQGPYKFEETVLQRRERCNFDAMSTHNPSIRFWEGKYYLFYMGTTYGGPIPENLAQITSDRYIEVWNRKRIGLAVSNSVFGPWIRKDVPLLEPRIPRYWDCTITTNPTVAILPDGSTYMIYKSREYAGATLQLGVAKASKPEGPYERLTDQPIFKFLSLDFHVEDPFLWYKDGLFHLLIKDDFKNNCGGITGEWGAGIYATSKDCIQWNIHNEPKAYSRRILWDDGTQTVQCNLERPSLLLTDTEYDYISFATATGPSPWNFKESWNMMIPISKGIA